MAQAVYRSRSSSRWSAFWCSLNSVSVGRKAGSVRAFCPPRGSPLGPAAEPGSLPALPAGSSRAVAARTEPVVTRSTAHASGSKVGPVILRPDRDAVGILALPEGTRDMVLNAVAAHQLRVAPIVVVGRDHGLAQQVRARACAKPAGRTGSAASASCRIPPTRPRTTRARGGPAARRQSACAVATARALAPQPRPHLSMLPAALVGLAQPCALLGVKL